MLPSNLPKMVAILDEAERLSELEQVPTHPEDWVRQIKLLAPDCPDRHLRQAVDRVLNGAPAASSAKKKKAQIRWGWRRPLNPDDRGNFFARWGERRVHCVTENKFQPQFWASLQGGLVIAGLALFLISRFMSPPLILGDRKSVV